MRFLIFRVLAVCALLLGYSSTRAGPPLSIDDPGILDPGRWEIIAAVTKTSSDSGDYIQLPLLDMSVGMVRDSVQLSAVLPYAEARPKGAGSARDFGNFELGVKWRFFHNQRFSAAFAPNYIVGVSRNTADNGIGTASDVIVIPVNAEYRINDIWRLNAELGYASVDNGTNDWTYGAAVAYAIDEQWELLVELAGVSNPDFEADFVEARMGFDVSLSESLRLLFSIATGINEPNGSAELDHDIFLGLQYFP